VHVAGCDGLHHVSAVSDATRHADYFNRRTVSRYTDRDVTIQNTKGTDHTVSLPFCLRGTVRENPVILCPGSVCVLSVPSLKSQWSWIIVNY